jgi:hypothetical protein
MRAYMIVIFILAIHASLAVINVANIMDVGLNLSLDTSSHGAIIINHNSSIITVPSSKFFNESATGTDISEASKDLNRSSFSSGAIESIIGFATVFGDFIKSISKIVFSIHDLTAPLFGNFNAWVLEGMVDFILTIALFQMVTGRSFKTME